MSGGSMTPDRVLTALAKNPKLLYDVIWNAQVLGAWVKEVRHHKGKTPTTTTWTRHLHPRLKGSSPVAIEQVGDPYDGGVTFVIRIDTNGDGDKGYQREMGLIADARAQADRVLQNGGWVLVDDDDDEAESETQSDDLRDTLQRILTLLADGKQSFADWRADTKAIDLQALNQGWDKGRVLNHKRRSWQDYIRNDAMPRNQTIRGLLTQISPTPFPAPVAEFFAYCDEYDDLFVTWDKGATVSLATGRNFPANLDGFVLGMLRT